MLSRILYTGQEHIINEVSQILELILLIVSILLVVDGDAQRFLINLEIIVLDFLELVDVLQ